MIWVFVCCCACLGVSLGIALTYYPRQKLAFAMGHYSYLLKGKRRLEVLRKDEETRVLLYRWARWSAVVAAVLVCVSFQRLTT